MRGDGTAYTVEARQVPQAVAFCAAGQDGFTPSSVCPPESWECVAWKANGGYAVSQENSAKERIWFSPHCISGKQGSLFSGGLNAPEA